MRPLDLMNSDGPDQRRRSKGPLRASQGLYIYFTINAVICRLGLDDYLLG